MRRAPKNPSPLLSNALHLIVLALSLSRRIIDKFESVIPRRGARIVFGEIAPPSLIHRVYNLAIKIARIITGDKFMTAVMSRPGDFVRGNRAGGVVVVECGG